MRHTVHVPRDFEHSDLLHYKAAKLGLSTEPLSKSKSFRVGGHDNAIKEFIKYLEHFAEKGVAVLGSDRKAARSRISRVSPIDTPEAVSYFTPPQIAQVYGITSNQTSRVGVGIIELGGGYNPSDLTAYWAGLGLKTIPNVTAVSVDGAQNTPGSGADYEVALDIEVIGGIVPNSNIYVYFAPNTDSGFYDAFNAAMTSGNLSVISVSWGSGENYWASSALTSYNALFQQASEDGITICVASGDGSSSDGESSGNHVDFPASSPYVLACGGTHLVCPNFVYGSSTTSESVWGSGSATAEGGGGGFSVVFPRPSYQTAALAGQTTTTGRGVPDICGDADPSTGWRIYIYGAYTVIGGTSAVAPLWAALLASINYKEFANTALYSLWGTTSNIVHDIVSGNQGYPAAVGWDPASGLGSPNGSVLLPALIGGSTPTPPPSPPPSPPPNPPPNPPPSPPPNPPGSGTVVILNTMADYNAAIAQAKTIIFYWAAWASPALQAVPQYTALAATYTDISFCEINVANANFAPLLQEYNITAIPVFMYFCSGKNIIKTIGYSSYSLQANVQQLEGTKGCVVT